MTEPKMDLSNPERMGAIGRLHTERGRALGLGVLAALLAVLVVWISGTRNLDGLPDVGDPFDVAAARLPIDIPDSDNA
jgi:cobalamin synthase